MNDLKGNLDEIAGRLSDLRTLAEEIDDQRLTDMVDVLVGLSQAAFQSVAGEIEGLRQNASSAATRALHAEGVMEGLQRAISILSNRINEKP
jgi:hypothetical protein